MGAEKGRKIMTAVSSLGDLGGIEMSMDLNGDIFYKHLTLISEDGQKAGPALRKLHEMAGHPHYVIVWDGRFFSNYNPVQESISPTKKLKKGWKGFFPYGRYVVDAEMAAQK